MQQQHKSYPVRLTPPCIKTEDEMDDDSIECDSDAEESQEEDARHLQFIKVFLILDKTAFLMLNVFRRLLSSFKRNFASSNPPLCVQ